MSKRKGSRTERELIDILWANKYAAVRAAGSGVSRFYCPDLIASKGSKVFAIECKSTKKKSKYIENKQWTELQKFADIFGAVPLIALRMDKEGWYFFEINDLEKTSNGNLKINQKIIENKGKIIYDLDKI
jgi:Holliday junction resolvase